MKNFKKRIMILLTISLSLFIIISAVSATDLDSTLEVNTDKISDDTSFLSPVDIEVNKKSSNIKSNNEPKTIGLNSTTFDTYVTDGSFNDLVSDGDTIDVNGKLDGDRFSLNVNKSLNFISSNNESYINLYTQNAGDYGEATGGQLTFGHGASGSNITNLYFYNTRVQFTNVSNVNINNITVIDYEKNIGSGTGHFIIGGQSDNVNITNSYFYTKDNGQHSTAVFSGCSNILFENNTIIGEGAIGNLLYLNTFNVDLDENTTSHSNFIIRNNLINASQAPSQVTCYAICLTGSNILIDNNTVDYNGTNISPIFGGQGVLENITLQNNNLKTVLLGNAGIITVKHINNTKIINNNISYLIVSKATESTHRAEMYNNTIQALRLEANDCIVEGNNLKNINNSGSNNIINNNTISTMGNYTITTTGENTTITNNKLASKDYYGDESINGSATLDNNTGTNRTITITDDNIDEYTTLITEDDENFGVVTIRTITSVIKDGDTLIFKLNSTNPTGFSFIDENSGYMPSLIIKDSVLLSDMISIYNSTIINCSFPYAVVTPITSTLINSTIAVAYNDMLPLMGEEPIELYEPVLDNSIILSRLNESTHAILYYDELNHLFSNTYMSFLELNYNCVDISTGYLSANVIEEDVVYFRNQGEITNLIIDRPINLIGLGANNLKSNITFVEGSEGSNITNMVFDESFILNTTDINYENNNNIFNSLIIDNINNIIVGLNTSKSSVTINVEDIPTLVNGEITPIMINVTDSNNTPVNEGYVEVYLDGIYQDKIDLGNNNIIVNVTSDRIGNITLKVWYYGEDNYMDNTTTKTVESIKSNLTYIILTDSMNVGENITLEAQVTSNNNKIVNEGNITFIYRSNRYITEVTNSTAKVNVTVLESWYDKPTLTLVYSGSALYNDYASTYNTTINKGTTNFQIKDVTTQLATDTPLEFSLTNKAGQNITNGIITLTDKNGNTLKTINLTQENTITLNMNTMYNGTITAEFKESKYYENNQTTFTLTTTKPETIINIDGINLTAGQTVTLTARLTDQLENNITGGKVVFKVNGKTLKDSSGKVIYAKVENGVATAEYTVPDSMAESNITIQATYTGTSKYNKETAEITTEVAKQEATLTIDELPESIQANSNITITARVQAGDTPITTGKVVFKINGKTLKDDNGKVIYAKVDSNGTATITGYNIGDLKATSYTLKAVFTATGYNKLEANQTIDVIRV